MRSTTLKSVLNVLAVGPSPQLTQWRLMSSQKRMCSLIVGAPGSGKGTISNWIVRDFGLSHVSSGDLLRKHVREGTDVGKLAKQFIDKGGLVPDEVMVKLISTELKTLEKANLSWLLDGFPRTRAQATALQTQTPVNVVIHLDVPFETIIGRVKDRWLHPGSNRIYNTEFNPPKVPGKDDVTGEDLIQREDDKPENVLRRLEVFSAETKPVLDFYREQGVLKEFHGTESKKIWPHVEKYLKSIV